MKKNPNVTVLMATYNGGKWLEPQLQSILKQKEVKIKLLIQDDNSEDNTQKIIKKFQKNNNIIFKINKKNQGSASLNFLNLIKKTRTTCDYYAFSDQDDVWENNKVISAINLIKNSKFHAYSSNVSILEDGKKILMNKSNKQKKYDFIFESVPGHTIILSKNAFLKLKKKLITFNEHQLKRIDFHDRFIYFYLRSINFSWYIDKLSFVNYRQHENNVFGVNYGFGFSKKKINGIKKRLQMIVKGNYRNSILNLAKLTKLDNWVIRCVKRLNFFDRLKLILNIYHFRRSKLDCLFLIVIFFLMKKTINKSI